MKRILAFALTLYACIANGQPRELRTIIEVFGRDTSNLGSTVKGVGDLNHDGFADVAVSAERKRRTHIYFGGNPMSTTPARTFPDCGGTVVSGDFNADGWLDLAIQRKFTDTVFVYYGSATLDTISDLTLRGENAGDGFGARMARGDINGDGVDDVVIAAAGYPYNQSFEFRGKVYVYAGGNVLDSIPRRTFLGDTLRAFLGWDVACDDIDNDGKSDLIVLGNNEFFPQGQLWYFYLSIFRGASNFLMGRNYYVDSRHVPGSFEENVKSFDSDSDGVGDILVNRIHIFKGGAMLDTLPSYTILPPNNDTLSYGRFPRVGGGGDFNRDGVKDIIMGSTGFAPRILVYLGGRGLRQGFVAFKQRTDGSFGGAFDNAGDVNGDGVDDIIVGSAGYFIGNGQGMFGIYSGDTSLVVSVQEQQSSEPQSASLKQNYPNPFNPGTTIEYTLPKRDFATIRIFNSLGEEIVSLVKETQNAGVHRAEWDGRNRRGEPMPSGVYFYQLQTPTIQHTKKLIHLK